MNYHESRSEGRGHEERAFGKLAILYPYPLCCTSKKEIALIYNYTQPCENQKFKIPPRKRNAIDLTL